MGPQPVQILDSIFNSSEDEGKSEDISDEDMVADLQAAFEHKSPNIDSQISETLNEGFRKLLSDET